VRASGFTTERAGASLLAAVALLLAAFAGTAPAGAAGPGVDWSMRSRLLPTPLSEAAYADAADELAPDLLPLRLTMTGGCDPAAAYRWTVDGARAGAGAGLCTIERSFDEEGDHSVAVEVDDGTTRRVVTASIPVEDWLVVSIGDSVGSGEGNPTGRRGWRDRRCHRSADAAPVRAATTLERIDPRTTVSLLHLACSGAQIRRGLLEGYDGIEPGREPLAPQLDELDAAARIRAVDAVIVDVGANDALFSRVVAFCLMRPRCVDRPFDPERPLRDGPPYAKTLREVVRERIGRLPALYDEIAQRLAGVVAPRHVLLVEYFDPTHDEHGATCRRIGLPGKSIDAAEATWAREELLGPLNDAIATAAREHDWTAVTGVAEAFAKHGYCADADDRWIRTLSGSLWRQFALGTRLQLAVAGALHPNARGHQAIAELIAPQLWRALASDAEDGGGSSSGSDGDGAPPDDANAWPLVGLGLLAALPIAALASFVIARRRGRRSREQSGEAAGPEGPPGPPGPPGPTGPRGPTGPSAAPRRDRSPAPLEASERTSQASRLLALRPEWVVRRVERLVPLSADAIRHQVSVDVEIPTALDGRCVVPLGFAAKGRISQFDARDEDGRALPLEPAGALGTALLAERARGSDFPVEPALLEHIATAPPEAALHELGRLRVDRPLAEMAALLAEYELVAVELERGGGRRVLKYAYTLELERPTRLLSRWRRALLAWRGIPFAIGLPDIGGATEHLLELEEVPGSEYYAVRAGGRRPIEAQGPAKRMQLRLADDAASGGPWSGGLTFRMRAERGGHLARAALFGLAVTTVVATVLTLEVSLGTRGELIANIALVIVGLLGGYIVAGAGEHPLTSRLLLVPRALSGLVSLVSLGAASLLVISSNAIDEAEFATFSWTIIGFASVVAAALTITWIAPVVRSRPQSAEGVSG
jgi:lysophospholipase L1-like esterase